DREHGQYRLTHSSVEQDVRHDFASEPGDARLFTATICVARTAAAIHRGSRATAADLYARLCLSGMGERSLNVCGCYYEHDRRKGTLRRGRLTNVPLPLLAGTY